MRYEWLDDYLMAKRAVTRDLQPDWNWIRYKIGDRMFAAVPLDDSNKPCFITLKVDPTEGEFLRAQYTDVIPGYYCDKQHWISVQPDGAVPDGTLRRLLDKARLLVLEGFSGRKQREILGLSACGTECGSCAFFGENCPGCNAARGKVFHAPAGRSCPIHACAVGKRRGASCARCGELPCGLWRATRDPRMDDAAFAENTAARIANLKEGWE